MSSRCLGLKVSLKHASILYVKNHIIEHLFPEGERKPMNGLMSEIVELENFGSFYYFLTISI